MLRQLEYSYAPDIPISLDRGRQLRLSDLRGQKVVVFLCPTTDAACAEINEFAALMQRFEDCGVWVIGLVDDKAAPVDPHASGIPMGKIDGTALRESLGLPCNDTEGLTIFVDRAGTIRKSWSGVRMPGHASAVLEAAMERP